MQAFFTLGMGVVLLLAVQGSLLRGRAEEEAERKNSTSCPDFMVPTDKGCTFDPARAVKSKFHHEAGRYKRQTTSSCPYCARGVVNLYPDWSDCSQFYYCKDGVNTLLSCPSITSMPFFNPISKACEVIASANNNCINRSYNLLAQSIQQG